MSQKNNDNGKITKNFKLNNSRKIIKEKKIEN